MNFENMNQEFYFEKLNFLVVVSEPDAALQTCTYTKQTKPPPPDGVISRLALYVIFYEKLLR